MPELPEVESLRRGLVKHIIGSKILKVEIRNEKIVAGKGTTRKADKNKTKEFKEELIGKKIIEIDRRAKNLIIKLSTTSPNLSLKKERDESGVILVHLKMTGQLVFKPTTPSFASQNPPLLKKGNFPKSEIIVGGHPIQESEQELPHKHTYIIFHLDNGILYYNDVRQFGYVLYFPNFPTTTLSNSTEFATPSKEGELEHFKDLGIEPFDKSFTEKYFKNEIKKYNSPIKKVLLDQKIVVGCGNIYTDEVLWYSSVLPTRICKTLTDIEIKNIYKYIKIILENAINAGGSSVANYLLADGSKGNYAHSHKAYKKQGQKCTYTSPSLFPTTGVGLSRRGKEQCSGTIEKINFAGRGTHFCPTHQK